MLVIYIYIYFLEKLGVSGFYRQIWHNNAINATRGLSGLASSKDWSCPRARYRKRYAAQIRGKPMYIFVDVDETFVRNYGTKQIPIPSVIEHIKELKEQGAIMYCWSSGGSDYAKASAIECKIDHCFVGFLPKPDVMIDDLSIENWRGLLHVHPNQCPGNSVITYKEKIRENRA